MDWNLRLRLAAVLWLLVAAGAGLMAWVLLGGGGGDSEGPWYLAFAILALAIFVVAVRARDRRVPALIAGGSLGLAALIAIHAMFTPFAYQGLTRMLLVPGVVAAALALVGWQATTRTS